MNINPRCTSVVSTEIKAIHALYIEHLHKLVSHIEVEKLYRYIEINSYSEVIRNNFFDMLAESEDASNRNDYLTPEIITGAISDARYNPMHYSGISEIDQVFDDMGNDTYIRTHTKVGRNDHCPCGSVRKFKKCCIGKGEYD